MDEAQRVKAFLVSHGGQGFCDDCLRKALHLRNIQAAQRASRTLARNRISFSRQTMICGGCGNDRMAIRALWPGF